MTSFIKRAVLVALGTAALGGYANAQTPDADAPPTAPSSSAPGQPAYSPPAEGALRPDALPPVNRPPAGDDSAAPSAPSEAPTMNAPPERPRAKPETVVRYTVEGEVEASAQKSRALRVEKGDTVNNLAAHFMASKKTIIEINKLKKPYELEIGSALKIPTPKVYIVGSGDTLFSIGRRFTTPASLLAELNDFEVNAHLRPGQKIILPEEYKDIGPIAVRVAAGEAEPPTRPRPPVRSYKRIEAEPSTDNGAPSSQVSPGQPSYARPTPTIAPLTDAQISAAGRGLFTWPLHGEILIPFGPMAGGQRNDGLDIAAPMGTPIQAAAGGDVVVADTDIPGFGTLMLIKHAGGWVTVYTHLSKTLVKIKDHVNQGDVIGEVGQSGGVAQPMLHFEIRMSRVSGQKANPIDPALVLPK
jgi:murein DD-endopeptidase MepM/ murein hydrolase activator NlpD